MKRAWFPKDKGGGVKYLTYGPMGKIQMSMRKPIKLSTAFLVFFFPNHLFLPECGGVSYCMEWEEYGKKFELGRDPFLKNVFWLPWQKKCPKTYAILPYIHVFHFPHHSPSRWGFWEQLEFFLCLSFHVFGCWLHFSQGLEVVFVMPGTGLFSSRFGSCWCIFHSRFWKFHVFLPWLRRAIHVFGYLTDYWSHTQTIWVIFPCYKLCSLMDSGL